MSPSRIPRVAHRSGFSLLQVLVSISIASIVSLSALPITSGYVKKYRLVGGANQVAFDIARARTQAIAQNMFARIRFQDASHYVRELSTDGVTYTQDGVSSPLPSGVTAQEPPTTTFNRNGMALAATTISLTNGQMSRTIRTNVLGRLTIS